MSHFLHRYAALTIVLASVLMAVTGDAVGNITLPTMTRFFAVDHSSSQWTITAYLIITTSCFSSSAKLRVMLGGPGTFLSGLLCLPAVLLREDSRWNFLN
ncbi:MAG: hypothetical protein WCF90_11155 [Methanomicrobiales archaeon]